MATTALQTGGATDNRLPHHDDAHAGAAIARPHLDAIIADASRLGPARVAVAYPCSASAIEAVVTAQRMGLAEPILVGPRRRIEAIAEAQQFDVSRMAFADTGDDPVSAGRACVGLCQDDRANLIMKGSLHTDELLAVVVGRDSGLRTARRMSHAFVFDLPEYASPLLMADCVVNITPTLMEKRDITQNAIDLARTLGIERPYVGILSAIETINPAIPGTIEAAALSKMAERGQISGATVEGPLGFDIAISMEAARIKGVDLHGRGRPDILIMPNLEAGNMLYKQLVYLAHAECAGIVLGTLVPIVLTSRADSPQARVASCALAVLQAKRPAARPGVA
jgi:phosphate acetyltransferase